MGCVCTYITSTLLLSYPFTGITLLFNTSKRHENIYVTACVNYEVERQRHNKQVNYIHSALVSVPIDHCVNFLVAVF